MLRETLLNAGFVYTLLFLGSVGFCKFEGPLGSEFEELGKSRRLVVQH